MKARPPVVVVMGHIDHGKTTLLDYIRKTNVAAKEAGGITQSIGAYEIEHKSKKITFIDTPGHEAFSKMRSYGARVADLAILVVAADDGVKPETKDALKHIQAARIPYVVAINKIDLPNADVEKTKQDLTKNGVFLEGYGGNISFQAISAKKGDGVDDLLDLVNLAAEVEDLKYDPNAPGRGFVTFSARDPKKGLIVGVIIKDGKLKVGDEIYSESTEGKIRSLQNFLGKSVKELEPSSPALILGFDDLPKIGEVFSTGEKPKAEQKRVEKPISSEEGEVALKVVLKSNESGSLDVLEDRLSGLSTPDFLIRIIDKGVGNINEGDLQTAFSSDAVILGFGVKTDKVAESIAKSQKVKIITSPVIYDLEKKLKEMIKLLSKKEDRVIQILKTFGEAEGKQIVGGKVVQGYVKNQESFRVLQDENEIGTGRIINLQSQRKDVAKAEEGQEVGLLVESGAEIRKGHRLIFEGE